MSSTNALKAAATGGAVAKTPDPAKPKNAIAMLQEPNMLMQLKAALPRHMAPERMVRLAMTAMRTMPKLQQADPMSFIGAVVQCSQLGLEPNTPLGHAYILPFDRSIKQGRDWVKQTEAQVIIGYRGMIDLARRSGQIISLDARAVYEGDRFEVTLGLDPNIVHVPAWNNANRTNGEALMFVYAVAKLKDGGTQFDVMSREEILSIRERSQGYKMAAAKVAEGKRGDNPWITDFAAMALKTVIRRLFKFLPVSIELQTAVGLDEQADANVTQDLGGVIDGATSFVDDDELPPADNPPNGMLSSGIAPAGTATSAADPKTGELPHPQTVMERIDKATLDELTLLDEEVRAMKDATNKKILEAAIRVRFEDLTTAQA